MVSKNKKTNFFFQNWKLEDTNKSCGVLFHSFGPLAGEKNIDAFEVGAVEQLHLQGLDGVHRETDAGVRVLLLATAHVHQLQAAAASVDTVIPCTKRK